MEFSQLIAPDGEWNKVWLAAHWEKRLKKQDYLEIDLRLVMASFLAKKAILSLRATGHLLVGGAKVVSKKLEILEEEVQEVRRRLWLAFSGQQPAASRKGEEGEKLGQILREVDTDSVGPHDENALLGGKRHVARLEDITLKGPIPGLLARLAEAENTAEEWELFGATTGQELSGALRFIAGLAPGPGMDEAEAEYDTQPLDAEDERAGAGGCERKRSVADTLQDLETPVPLEMDLEPPSAPDIEAPFPELDLGVGDVGLVVDPAEADAGPEGAEAERPEPKRRRLESIFDEVTEIPRDSYQRYVVDRSAITLKKAMDYTIVLPLCSPSLPNFTTTYTELCPQLNDMFRWGTLAAAKMRQEEAERELDELQGRDIDPTVDRPRTGPAAAGDARGVAEGHLHPAERAAERLAFLVEKERALLKGAPKSLSKAVLANPDAEEQCEPRVGYSSRTERMHRYLASEFLNAGSDGLSYEKVCRGHGRRELVAGSFFELLVLKTNGTVNLRQEKPMGDIRIMKASQWAL